MLSFKPLFSCHPLLNFLSPLDLYTHDLWYLPRKISLSSYEDMHLSCFISTDLAVKKEQKNGKLKKGKEMLTKLSHSLPLLLGHFCTETFSDQNWSANLIFS